MKSSKKSSSNIKQSSSKSSTGSKKRIGMLEKQIYELEQSTKRFADIIQIAGDAIISIDEKYSIQLFNKEAEKIFGYKSNEVIGKSINILIPNRFTKDHDQHIKSFENSRVASKKMGERTQVFGRKKDGSEFPAEASISKLIEKDGIDFTVVVRDITERILSEKKLKDIASDLQASQQKLSIHVKQTPLGVIEWNEDFEVVDWNPAAEKIFGYSKQEAMGRHAAGLIVPEEFKEHVATIWKALIKQSGGGFSINDNFKKDGKQITCEWYNTPLVSDEGITIGVASFVQDVTERKKVEGEKERLASIIEANTDFVGLADLKGQMFYINNAGKKLVGLKINEKIESINVVDFHPKKDHIILMKEILPELMEKGIWQGEYFFRNFKTGKPIPIDMIAFRIDDKKTGQPVAIATISRDITDRKKLEDEKERVGLELLQFIETANAPIFGIDLDGEINEWNKTAERIFGYTKDDVMGRNLVENFITDDYKKPVKSVLDDALKGKETSNYEIPLYTKKDEREVIILLNATTRRDIEGKITGVIGVGQDITERKQSEEKLKSNEEKFRTLFEGSSDSIMILDARGFVDCNKATLEMFGFKDKSEFIGTHPADLSPPRQPDGKESMKSANEKLARAFKTGSNQFDWVHLKKNGKDFSVNVLLTAFKIGKRDLIQGTVRDITELNEYRTNMEQLVEERTEELNRSLEDTEEARNKIDGIIKSVADGLIVTDMQNRVILMNSAAEDLLEVKFSEVVDRPIDFAIKDTTLRDRMKSTLDKGKTGNTFDFELPGKNEQRSRIMLARTSVIADKSGEKTGIVTIIHDVTHVREIDQMKTEFISTAAHELRTPLTSIQGFSEILMTRKNLKNEDKRKYLGYINKQAVGLAAIINDLLDISRIESGVGFSLNRVWCKTGEAIPGAVEMFKDQAEIENFTLDIELPKKDVEIFVDKDKMAQVLINILSNAVKYSPDGGKIIVKGEVKNEDYIISVSDEGIGMTEEQVSHVFDKFYRVDASDSAVEGTGLGMSIVKHIVDAHQGRIWIKSEPGKGTGVYISLPMQSNI